MKKRHYLSVLAMLIAVSVLVCTGCGGKETLSSVKPTKYVKLGEYKGLTVSAPDTTVSEGEIEDTIMAALESQATEDPVTDRAVQDGDIVNIDYAGTKDGVSFDGGTGTNDLTIGSGTFIDGFEDGIIGMKTGETKDLNLTFPADYSKSDLAGQDVVFKVTVNSISVNNVPKLTDEIVPKLNANCKTVDEYMGAVKKSLEDDKKQTAENKEKSELMEKAVSNASCDEEKLPKWLVSQNQTQYTESITSFAKQYGLTMDQYLQATGSTQAQFDEQAEKYGREISKQQLVTYAIADAEKIALSANELDTAYKNYAAQYGTDVDTLKTQIDEETLSEYLLSEHVSDFLLKNAKITTK